MAEEEGTYADWTVEELREQAAARDIEGRSAMNKAELVAALEADDAGGEEPLAGVTETVPEPVVQPNYDEDETIQKALELEEPLKALADSLPAGDNSDALKAGIRNASHGIAHIRKAMDQMERLAAAR